MANLSKQGPSGIMIVHSEITAFILAAGVSSRMGRFKPLLPLGSATVLERSIQLFLDAGIEDIRVVVGYHADDLVPLLRKLGVRWVVNERFPRGYALVCPGGVETFEPAKKAFFLLPADIPLVRPSTLTDLLSAYDKHSADVLYPCFFGKRGIRRSSALHCVPEYCPGIGKAASERSSA